MERYSKILDKDKREIVLLIGSGCKWHRCKFCNYYLDQTCDEQEEYKINHEVLSKVTGEFSTLEAINSGSIFELSEKCKKELLDICVHKGITKLIIESHYLYRKEFEVFRQECANLGISLKIKGGLETFNAEFREKVLNKGFGYPTLEDLKNAFDEVNLLVGVKGQTLEDVQKDIELALNNFERVCVNLYKEMDGLLPSDEDLKQEFVTCLYPKYKDNPNVDILIFNTDFGVGD